MRKISLPRWVQHTLVYPAYANIHKNGSIKQREQLDFLEKVLHVNLIDYSLSKVLVNQISMGSFTSISSLIAKTNNRGDAISALLSQPAVQSESAELERILMKRKKNKSLDQGLIR